MNGGLHTSSTLYPTMCSFSFLPGCVPCRGARQPLSFNRADQPAAKTEVEDGIVQPATTAAICRDSEVDRNVAKGMVRAKAKKGSSCTGSAGQGEEGFGLGCEQCEVESAG